MIVFVPLPPSLRHTKRYISTNLKYFGNVSYSNVISRNNTGIYIDDVNRLVEDVDQLPGSIEFAEEIANDDELCLTIATIPGGIGCCIRVC